MALLVSRSRLICSLTMFPECRVHQERLSTLEGVNIVSTKIDKHTLHAVVTKIDFIYYFFLKKGWFDGTCAKRNRADVHDCVYI